MNRNEKILVYGCLLLSLACALFVIGGYGFPGAESLSASNVNDTRVNPSDPVTWNVTVLNNVTFWVNITLTYNTTVHGPFNVTLNPAGEAIINDAAPAAVGNYTVYVTTLGGALNDTYVGFIVDLYNIDVGALYTEVEAGFNSLIYANGSSVIDGTELTDGDTLIINGITLGWNTYLARFEGTVTSAIPVIVTYNTLTSLIEVTDGITNGNITSAPTIIWTTDRLTLIIPFLRSGDWPGAIIQINVILMGQTVFWTFLLTAMSVAIYNHSGAETALMAWMLGWTTFSAVLHSQALTISLVLMAVGGGIYIAKFFLDRRTSI